MIKVNHYRKRVNVITEPREGDDPYTVNTYGFMKPVSRRIPVILKKISAQEKIFRKGEIVAEVKAANKIPPMLAPKELPKETKVEKISPERI